MVAGRNRSRDSQWRIRSPLCSTAETRRFNLVGDYSYGLYILCFPIQQIFVMLDPAITPMALLVCSFPAVLAFAMLSWHFVEPSFP